MDIQSFVADLLRQHKIENVFWLGCGGSLIDLYPAHCLLQAESRTISSWWGNAKEFSLFRPSRLGEKSLVVLCSHSGNTPEVLEAGKIAELAGAMVLAFTHNASSEIAEEGFQLCVYPWGEGVPASAIPQGKTLLLASELILKREERFSKYTAIQEGLNKIDDIIKEAIATDIHGLKEKFAVFCQKSPFFYVVGSGPVFSQTYGFSVCSLMEMQWQHCAYIHSGEYFHGPFEVTEEGVSYFLQMSAGISRPMDERALAFLKAHTDRLLVLDAKEFGMDAIPPEVNDYLAPIFFYFMNCELRSARSKVFRHPVKMRRYMGKIEY